MKDGQLQGSPGDGLVASTGSGREQHLHPRHDQRRNGMHVTIALNDRHPDVHAAP